MASNSKFFTVVRTLLCVSKGVRMYSVYTPPLCSMFVMYVSVTELVIDSPRQVQYPDVTIGPLGKKFTYNASISQAELMETWC